MARKPTQKRKAKPKRKGADQAQHKRFLETAKVVEADERPEAFERAFKKVMRKRVT